MSTAKFSMHLSFALTSFIRIAVTVYKDRDIEKKLSTLPRHNNGMPYLLWLKESLQTMRRYVPKMTGDYYNPHRKMGLIILQRPATPRSDFVHRV